MSDPISDGATMLSRLGITEHYSPSASAGEAPSASTESLKSIPQLTGPSSNGSMFSSPKMVPAKTKSQLTASPGVKIVEIDPNGDMLIEVLEKAHRTSGAIEASRQIPSQFVAFRVNRELVAKNSVVFSKMLKGQFAEAKKDKVTLEEDTVKSMELWFRHLHGVMIPEMDNIAIHEVWNVIESANKYGFHTEDLEKWFAQWFKVKMIAWEKLDDQKLKYKWMASLIFPSFQFDHASGFARASKYLVYESLGSLEEINPTEHRYRHLPNRVLQQLRAVKGAMRNHIHKAIFDQIPTFHKLSCKCRFEAAYNYEEGLLQTGVYPLQEYLNSKSITQLVEGLTKFTYTAPDGACRSCNKDFRFLVIPPIQDKIRKYFDGLCLTCMDNSESRNTDDDYWDHLKEWDFPCSCPGLTHGQPTWYHSFMGRSEVMDVHQAQKKRRKELRDRRREDEGNFFGFF